MTDYLYTENQVREMWKRSYGTQIGIAQAKCFEAIVRMDGKIAVSFSGGKDSAVVLYLMAEAWSISKHKDEPLQVFFSNTTNEFTSMLPYIREYIKYIEAKFEIKIKFEIVRGEYTYFQVIDMVGLPFVSKKVARMVRDVKATLKRLNLKYADIEPLMPKAFTDKHIPERIETAEKLRALGFNNVVILYLTGVTSENKTSIRRFLPLQYRPLLDAPFELSEKCCDYLKKKPLKIENKKLGGLLPVTGEMACDSKDRMNAYRQTGCNMFDGSRPKSKPLGAATEQTVLHFIYDEKIPIAPVYGEVVFEDGIYKTTGKIRTGCKLCGFGLMFDPERFVRLQKYEPKIVQFCFTSVENGGLGYGEICSFLNEHCGMKIVIPTIEQGYYPKRIRKDDEDV